jgi:hypothetical protein
MDRDRGRPPSPKEDDADPAMRAPIGKTTLRPAQVTWTGTHPAHHRQPRQTVMGLSSATRVAMVFWAAVDQVAQGAVVLAAQAAVDRHRMVRRNTN